MDLSTPDVVARFVVAMVSTLLAAEAKQLREKLVEVENARIMVQALLDQMRQRFMRKDQP